MPSAERFGRISEISPDAPASWEDRVFLTLDIDWASDEVLSDSVDIVEQAGVAATWFVTHDTPVLARLRANPRFELGIHPNFNFLLAGGDGRNGASAEEVLDRMLAIVPEAKAVRSHSMTQSSVLLNLFGARGLTHDCNHFIPHESGVALQPWRHWNALTKVPYFWEDDIHCVNGRATRISEIAAAPGLRVFDFHPIHVFLNTEHLDRYEDARPFFHDGDALVGRRCPDDGVRRLLTELLERS